ncbi:MAG: hypothetical protein QOI44_289, partial [Actinomycetota bacterium]|nr:hypothetical protein [Actinomycetota bacterium]
MARIVCTTLKPIDWSWPAMIQTRVIQTHNVHAQSATRVHAARRLIEGSSVRGVLDGGEAALDRG